MSGFGFWLRARTEQDGTQAVANPIAPDPIRVRGGGVRESSDRDRVVHGQLLEQDFVAHRATGDQSPPTEHLVVAQQGTAVEQEGRDPTSLVGVTVRRQNLEPGQGDSRALAAELFEHRLDQRRGGRADPRDQLASDGQGAAVLVTGTGHQRGQVRQELCARRAHPLEIVEVPSPLLHRFVGPGLDPRQE